MPRPRTSTTAAAARRLIPILQALRDDLLRAETEATGEIAAVVRGQRVSARNLVHYLALRRHDLRRLQLQLAELGLSSLGRCEAHALASVESVLTALRALAGSRPTAPSTPPPVDHRSGPRRLARQADLLFGAAREQRTARIMVTLPTEAATDPRLINDLFKAGMDLARINCAHDDTTVWGAMIGHLRKAARRDRRTCPILMDLGGPKLRTGAIAPGEQVVSWSPQRDHRGRVVRPARVALVAIGCLAPPGCSAWIPVAADLVSRGRIGDVLELDDARAKSRHLTVVGVDSSHLLVEGASTAYVEPGTRLRLTRQGRTVGKGVLGALPAREQRLMVMVGDQLVVTAAAVPGQPARCDAAGRILTPAHIPCSLPEVLAEVRAGQRIWFDDGKIGGVVTVASEAELTVEITQAKPGGTRLQADKGINLPDSTLTQPCLDAADLADLRFACSHADLIGLSFVRHPQDIEELRKAMGSGCKHPGIVLKIETPQAFANLSGLLLRALDAGPVGVMVARGDLAVEVGFARIAEVQEEILWLCEAAHIPVIWGTQVLEKLTKKGQATRAEVTDAAMSVRAECVMLNKGPYVVTTVRFLDDVLTRMKAHQSKKQTLLRSLAVSRRMPGMS